MRNLLIGLLLGALIFGGTPTQASFSPSIIKEIEYGTVTIINSSTSGTASISVTSTAKTVLINLGCVGTSGGASIGQLTLTSTTVVTAFRGDATANTTTCGFAAVEYY